MESTRREISPVRHEIDFSLTKQETEPHYRKVYQRAQQKVQLKGFRPGKTPIPLIKKMYGEALENEAVEEMVTNVFSKYIRENAIHPIGTPGITRLERTDDGGVKVTVAFETFPQVELGSYKGLPARRLYHVVTDEEVDREVQRLRERSASTEETDTVVDENHVVTIDLQKLDSSGAPIIGEVTRDLPLYLARPNVSPYLKELVMNRTTGDTFRAELPTEKDEKTMVPYEVTVKGVQRVVIPELDDAFAAAITGDPMATVEDFRILVRENIEATYDMEYSRLFRDEIVGKLVEQHPFEVPEALVHQALESFIEDMKKDGKGELPKGFDRKRFDLEMRPVAERTVRWALLRELIIQKEELAATDEDYEGLADMEAQRTGIDYDTLLAHFKRSSASQEKILAEKTLQLLEDYAIVDDVEDTEVMAAHRAAHRNHEHEHDHAHDHEHAGDHEHAHEHEHDHEHAHDHEHEHDHEHGHGHGHHHENENDHDDPHGDHDHEEHHNHSHPA